MEDKHINYYVHESEMARLERIIKRLWVLCIIVFVALIATNFGWIWYESQFIDEVSTETFTAESEGNGNAIINGEGSVIVNGESSQNENNQNQS